MYNKRQQMDLTETIKQYFEETKTQISTDFIDIFVQHYKNKNKMTNSIELYDRFKSIGYKSRYNSFCDRFILTMDQQYWKQMESLPYQKNGKVNKGQFLKKQYELTYKGVNFIMMQLDSKIAQYYLECESILQEFFEQYVIKQQIEITKLNEYIEENKQEYVIYEKQIVGESRRYRGISCNLRQRNQSHKRSSCNPELRIAYNSGKKIETKIIKRFRSLSRNECKQIERDAILEMPIEQRMNIKIPRVSENFLISPIQQQLVATVQEFDLTTVGEERMSYQEMNDLKWEEHYQQCLEYKQMNGKIPVEYGQDEQTQKLARWLVCMKQALKNKNGYRVTEERKQKIEYLLADHPNLEQQWNHRYNQCIKFKQDNNGKFPKKSSKDKNEHVLAVWLFDCRRFLQQGKYEQERAERISKLLDGMKTKESVWDDYFKECLEIKNKFDRLPNKNEKKVYSWLQDQKTFLKNKDPRLTNERIDKLQNLFNCVDIKSLDQKWDEKYEQCKQILLDKQQLDKRLSSWLYAQKKALDGVGYMNEYRRQRISEILNQSQFSSSE